MRGLLGALAAFGLLAGGTPAMAKKKAPRPSATAKKKRKQEAPRPPGDKGQNDGAQGRKNATEDAARAAEGSDNSHGTGVP